MCGMELPLQCFCGHETMLDLECLETMPISKIFTQEGFVCKNCKQWKPVFILTLSLSEAMRKLNQMSLSHKNYRFHFMKTVRKAMDVQKRGEFYGSSRNKNMAFPG